MKYRNLVNHFESVGESSKRSRSKQKIYIQIWNNINNLTTNICMYVSCLIINRQSKKKQYMKKVTTHHKNPKVHTKTTWTSPKIKINKRSLRHPSRYWSGYTLTSIETFVANLFVLFVLKINLFPAARKRGGRATSVWTFKQTTFASDVNCNAGNVNGKGASIIKVACLPTFATIRPLAHQLIVVVVHRIYRRQCSIVALDKIRFTHHMIGSKQTFSGRNLKHIQIGVVYVCPPCLNTRNNRCYSVLVNRLPCMSNKLV